MKGIITVDIGTTSMRAILFDRQGLALHIDQRENVPQFFNDGRVEQDPAAWQTIVCEVLGNCAKVAATKGVEPLCVSVTAQRSSVIPVDRDGKPLHPAIMWQDKRCAALALAMAEYNPLVYGKTGLKISPVFSALKMTWLRRNHPDIWQKTYKMIGIQDWVLYLLTGRFVTDQTFGSRTNLLDLKTRAWDPDLLSLFEVEPGMLCDLVEPGSVIGALTPAMALATGLPAGLPVVSAGGDQQCAALGLGLFSGEHAVSNTGTGSYLIGHTERPAFDEKMRLSCNVSAVPGAYIVEAAVLTSGTIYRWFAESIFGGNAPSRDTFAAVNAAAQSAPPGCNGLLLLPHFKGCGSPHWDPDAKGVFFNLTLSTSRGDMARAILEGIAVEMKGSLELVEKLCGTVASVTVSGGLTRSTLFNQIQSDIFERAVVRLKNDEATSLGAWIAGAVALGVEDNHAAAFARVSDPASAQSYQPDPALQQTYQRQSRQSQALYQALASPAFREQLK
ncbi:MAG: carbohydrate kinase [Proteobacteria bacterium]|nr:carbohydrate kinase [Pseudomonadota bacterium]